MLKLFLKPGVLCEIPVAKMHETAIISVAICWFGTYRAERNPMPVNYHTHTFRCGHAETVPDEAYLQRAIEQGFTVLGFSDHTPWQGLSRRFCRGVRMLPEELPGPILRPSMPYRRNTAA